MIKKLECVRTVHTKKVTNKFNYKHLATHPNIDIGAKVTLKRHGKEINIQSKYYWQVYKYTEKNSSTVTLRYTYKNTLWRNTASVKLVNIPDHKEDMDASIQEEEKSYSKQKQKTIHY